MAACGNSEAKRGVKGGWKACGNEANMACGERYVGDHQHGENSRRQTWRRQCNKTSVNINEKSSLMTSTRDAVKKKKAAAYRGGGMANGVAKAGRNKHQWCVAA